MGNLLKKLDEIMTSDFVRKIGGLFCLVAVIITAVAFYIGAKSVIKTMIPSVAVEVTDEEAVEEEEEATDEEEADDEAEEEAEE